ncbi:HGxxPAAW family protein [Streptomyces sp. KL118A]|uniref:HGxxPAAW family protein n=1 Tax=Streptomyces sp. KL118A TaxID=3045153 RepID=UPI00278C2F9A|nr:HGxxPAAW family protein [Streptomyces sp. KL118A]
MSGHHDEGHTVAGWTGSLVAMLGTVSAGVGVVGWRPGIWLGLILLVASVLVTWVLHLAGWGKPPTPRSPDQWRLSVRDLSVRAGHANCVGCRLAGRSGRSAVSARGTEAAVQGAEAS